ncbi:MAG: SDR family NAD(P)-dependent oxidoreductase [Myxococcota bacterium]
MKKTILITGATDGIGLATAEQLAGAGHHVLVHGRNPEKTLRLAERLAAQRYIADFSNLTDVSELATRICADHPVLDVLINNAGVFKTSNPSTDAGHDVRFVVNTLAPVVLTQRLLPILRPASRVINLSSAAQAPVDLDALSGATRVSDMEAYAQSKLALTMWSRASATPDGPLMIALNPGSLLATKMVEEAFGESRGGVEVGADVVCRAALGDDFADASGRYFDNDLGRFSDPHPDALDATTTGKVLDVINALTKAYR